MGNLTDAIERYLRQLLSEREPLEVQRRELAVLFRCVPSQINYVLETRFTTTRGYLVESRRGGGGYIRISRLPDGGIAATLGERVDRDEVPGLLARLAREGIISQVEAFLLQESLVEALVDRESDPAVIRARMLRLVLALLGQRGR